MRTLLILAVIIGLVGAGVKSRSAGADRVTLRLTLLTQWVVNQYRPLSPGAAEKFRAALDGGVVDRQVFAWQRGRAWTDFDVTLETRTRTTS